MPPTRIADPAAPPAGPDAADELLHLNPVLRIRREQSGALVHQPRTGRVTQVSEQGLLLLELYRRPRPAKLPEEIAKQLGHHLPAPPEGWAGVVTAMLRSGVLQCHSSGAGPAVAAETGPPLQADPTWTSSDVAVARAGVDARPVPGNLRPFWAHLQPFTRCNQRCLHCYCEGSSQADPFLLPMDAWHRIIDMLDRYGVFDILITGGESLLYDEFFDLAQDILGRGLRFGLSTNATILPERRLQRLQDLRLSVVQVSLDGAQAGVHEHIRGAPGSFERTLDGIRRIGEFTRVIINTVISRLNQHQMEAIVQLGIELGCRDFKFFPQKPVGRSSLGVTLSDQEILEFLIPECTRLATAYGVGIETINTQQPCGSGTLGLAVDQRGDVYPCIFGIQNPAQRCGNLLTDDLDDLWCDSTILADFRGDLATPCRRCESGCAR